MTLYIHIMSLFVTNENQELLWNVANQNMHVQQYFASIPEGTRYEWFKQQVRGVYEKYSNQPIDMVRLQEINKEAVLSMLTSAKSQDTKRFAMVPSPYQIPTPPMPQMNKTEVNQQQFQQKQEEYQNTLARPRPPIDVNFSEKIDDPVINNMDELLKQQIQQREQEYSAYAPPPINGSVPANAPAPHQTLRIDPNSNVTIVPDVIEPKKSVTWKPEIEQSGIVSGPNPSEKVIEEIRAQLQTAMDEIGALQTTVKKMALRITMLESEKKSTPAPAQNITVEIVDDNDNVVLTN
jgi:hypothetical protein